MTCTRAGPETFETLRLGCAYWRGIVPGTGLENVVKDHGLRPRMVGTIPMDGGDDETNELQVWFLAEHLVDAPLVRAR